METTEAEAPQMQIRLLHAPQWPAYRALMLLAYAESPDAFTSTPGEREDAPDAHWTRRIAGSEGCVLGAFRGETLVGAVALEFLTQEKTRHKAELLGFYIVPGARRSGVGRKLLTAAIAQARQWPGLRRLLLTVTEGNTAALALYESAGFSAYGCEPMAIHTADGRWLSKLQMGLTLEPAPPDRA